MVRGYGMVCLRFFKSIFARFYIVATFLVCGSLAAVKFSELQRIPGRLLLSNENSSCKINYGNGCEDRILESFHSESLSRNLFSENLINTFRQDISGPLIKKCKEQEIIKWFPFVFSSFNSRKAFNWSIGVTGIGLFACVYRSYSSNLYSIDYNAYMPSKRICNFIIGQTLLCGCAWAALSRDCNINKETNVRPISALTPSRGPSKSNTYEDGSVDFLPELEDVYSLPESTGVTLSGASRRSKTRLKRRKLLPGRLVACKLEFPGRLVACKLEFPSYDQVD